MILDLVQVTFGIILCNVKLLDNFILYKYFIINPIKKKYIYILLNLLFDYMSLVWSFMHTKFYSN
jgi:hypothetical protein